MNKTIKQILVLVLFFVTLFTLIACEKAEETLENKDNEPTPTITPEPTPICTPTPKSTPEHTPIYSEKEVKKDEKLIDEKTVGAINKICSQESYILVDSNKIEKLNFKGDSEIVCSWNILNTGDSAIICGYTHCDKGRITRSNKGVYLADLQFAEIKHISDTYVAKIDDDLNIEWFTILNNQKSNFNALPSISLTAEGNINCKIFGSELDEISSNVYNSKYGDEAKEYNLSKQPLYSETYEYTEYIQLSSDGKIIYRSEKPMENWAETDNGWMFEEAEFDITVLGEDKQLELDVKYKENGDYKAFKTKDDGYIFYRDYVNSASVDELLKEGFHGSTVEIYEKLYSKYLYSEDKDDEDFIISLALGQIDGLVIKTDDEYKVEWYRYCGGTGDDRINFGVEGSDGNYYFTGSSWSRDGDVTGWKPGKCTGDEVGIFFPEDNPWNFVLSPKGELIYSKCNSDRFHIAPVYNLARLDNGNSIWFERDHYEDDDKQYFMYFWACMKKHKGSPIKDEDVVGTYLGSYSNKSGEMNLKINIFCESDSYKAIIKFEPTDSNKEGYQGSYLSKCNIDFDTGYVKISSESWISEKPEDYSMLDIYGYIYDGKFFGKLLRGYDTDCTLTKILE